MLALATQEDPAIFISTFELDEPNQRYTVDTLTHFRSKFGESADLFFIMGADSWSEIPTWRAWQHLMTMVNHIVVTRPGYDLNLDHVTASVAAQVVDLRSADQSSLPRRLNETFAAGTPGIFITNAVMIDVSATEIRRAAREERVEVLKKFVPPSVADYIRKYKLYRNSNEA
jgi:nicotinate-nucleotide adenylyltransferase